MKFRFPWSQQGGAFLSINSDVEWTTWEVQKEIIDLFDAHELKSSFSYWFFCNPKYTWHFFDHETGKERPEAEEAFELAKKGYFDTLHSFGGRRHGGGCEYTMEAVERAYEEFAERGVEIPIFSNHGGDTDNQNVGGDWATHHQGDLPEAPFYHLDRTLSRGVKYFWCDPDYVIDTPFLEASVGERNSLFVNDRVRDGSNIHRFRRFMGLLEEGCCLTNLEEQVDQLLGSLSDGYCVIYQHLGVVRNSDQSPRCATIEEVHRYLVPSLKKIRDAVNEGVLTFDRTSSLLDQAASRAGIL